MTNILSLLPKKSTRMLFLRIIHEWMVTFSSSSSFIMHLSLNFSSHMTDSSIILLRRKQFLCCKKNRSPWNKRWWSFLFNLLLFCSHKLLFFFSYIHRHSIHMIINKSLIFLHNSRSFRTFFIFPFFLPRVIILALLLSYVNSVRGDVGDFFCSVFSFFSRWLPFCP